MRSPGDPAIQLITADDEGRPERTVALYRELARKHNPIAFAYSVGIDPVDTLIRKRIPGELDVSVLGALPSTALKQLDRHVFQVGVGEMRQLEIMFDHMRSVGIKQISLTIWDTAPSHEMIPEMEAAWKARGLRVNTVFVAANGMGDIPAALFRMLESSPEAIACLLPLHDSAVLVRELRAKQRKVAFYGTSMLESRLFWALAEGENARGAILSQYVPNPFSPRRRIVTQYHSDLKTHAPNARVGSYSLEGYIAGRILTEAVRRAGSPPDASTVRSALERMQGFDLGDLPVNFSPSNHVALNHIDISIVSDGGKLVY